MSDIKITLSTDLTFRSQSIEEEARWMQEEGELFYPLQGKPQRAQTGCWVYFIRQSHLVARAKADDFVNLSIPEIHHSYTNQPERASAWNVKCSIMELAIHRLPHRGFQGFQYVTAEEQTRFESAFNYKS